jgi:hypothetical protein
MMYALKLTRSQLAELRKIADTTANRPEEASDVKASATLRKVLGDLREALVRADNDARIGKLFERFDALREAEKPELDEDTVATEEAIRRAPEILTMLTAGQVASYLGSIADDIVDPRQLLFQSLEKARSIPAADWAAFRDQVAGDISRLLANLDDDQERRINDQVVQFLIVARGLKPDEFKSQRPAMEQKAIKIVGDVGPTDVLRHVVEHALAEFLSNPQLPAALDARLKRQSVSR